MKKMTLNAKIVVFVLAAALAMSSISVIAAEMPTSYRYSKADAQKIALDYFGIEESDIIKTDCDFDDGKYEFEFTADGIRFECDVNALTGNVVDSEIKSKLLDSEVVNRYIANSGYISGEEAKELAFDKFNIAADAEIIDCEIELDDNDYEVEFVSDGVKYECEVNAVTGKIVDFKSKPQKSPSATQTSYQYSKADAQKIALDYFGIEESDIIKADCDFDDDKYEFEFTADGIRFECDVNALTGNVVDSEIKSKLLNSEVVNRYIANSGYISVEEAKELAFDKFNITADAEIIDCEIELDDNNYEVEFVSDGVKYECEVNAVTGKIVDFKSKPQKSPSATQITKDEAKRLALEHFDIGDDAAVKEMHVEMDNDRYEVEFCIDRMEYECEIHILTGKVVKAEMEYDD